MIPTSDQIDTYFRRLYDNYDDLIKLLGGAQSSLTAILGATDKPIPEAESLAGMVFEAALGLTFPEGGALFSFANHMIEGAKKMKEKVEEARKYQKLVDATLQRLQSQADDAAKKVSTAYNNGAMGMIPIIDSISDRLYKQKALIERLWEVFKSLQKVKAAEPFFNSIQWATLPALVSEESDDIRYIFTYILVRLAVFRFVKLNMHSQPNGIGLEVTQLLVTVIKPEGISESGCNYIFAHFRRSFSDSKDPKAVLPARCIVPILNYYDMIDNWYPDIDISMGSHEEQVKIMGDPRRKTFTTKMVQISSGMKGALPGVIRIPEFNLRAS
jgi:hypothetical protein